jgi:hypothetical protein
MNKKQIHIDKLIVPGKSNFSTAMNVEHAIRSGYDIIYPVEISKKTIEKRLLKRE